MQAAIEEKFCEELLPPQLAALEALLKQNKNGDGFWVGDKVNVSSLYDVVVCFMQIVKVHIGL